MHRAVRDSFRELQAQAAIMQVHMLACLPTISSYSQSLERRIQQANLSQRNLPLTGASVPDAKHDHYFDLWVVL